MNTLFKGALDMPFAFHYIITKGMKARSWLSCPIENYHGKPIYRKSFTQPKWMGCMPKTGHK